MSNIALRFGVTTLAAVVGTWIGGWLAVPIIALGAGLLLWSPALIGVACAVAWGLLLAVDAAAGNIGRLGGSLAGVMGLPAPVLILVTLLFPALLGWSAASLGNAARSVRATSRQPS
jgi:hypothetical protein